MDISVFLARLLGITITVIYAGVLFNVRRLAALFEDFADNQALLYLSGLFALVSGLLIVFTHNIWFGWPVLITIMGWIMLLKGMTLILFPGWTVMLTGMWRVRLPLMVVASLIMLIVGLYLTAMGFL